MACKLLVVDDDSDTRQFMHVLLTDAGYDVTAVGTFQAAQSTRAIAPPTLVITDVRLVGYKRAELIATCPTPMPAIVLPGTPIRCWKARPGGWAPSTS